MQFSWWTNILLVVHLRPNTWNKMLLMVSVVSLSSPANLSYCFFRVLVSKHLSVKWQHSGFIESMSAGRRFQCIWKGPPSNKPIKKACEVNMCWELNNAKSCEKYLKSTCYWNRKVGGNEITVDKCFCSVKYSEMLGLWLPLKKWLDKELNLQTFPSIGCPLVLSRFFLSESCSVCVWSNYC